MAAEAHSEVVPFRQLERGVCRSVEPGALAFQTIEDRSATAEEIDGYHFDAPSLNRYENSAYRIVVTKNRRGQCFPAMRVDIRRTNGPAKPTTMGAPCWVRRGEIGGWYAVEAFRPV